MQRVTALPLSALLSRCSRPSALSASRCGKLWWRLLMMMKLKNDHFWFTARKLHALRWIAAIINTWVMCLRVTLCLLWALSQLVFYTDFYDSLKISFTSIKTASSWCYPSTARPSLVRPSVCLNSAVRISFQIHHRNDRAAILTDQSVARALL